MASKAESLKIGATSKAKKKLLASLPKGEPKKIDPGFPKTMMGVKIYTQKDWDRSVKYIRGYGLGT